MLECHFSGADYHLLLSLNVFFFQIPIQPLPFKPYIFETLMPPTMRGATKALAIQKKVNNISIYNTKYFVWKASSSYKMTQAQLTNDIDKAYLNVQQFFYPGKGLLRQKIKFFRYISCSDTFKFPCSLHILFLFSGATSRLSRLNLSA